MQVSVENTGGLERKLTVHIPEEEISGKVETKLRELCKQVKIKGFRPGRVPMSVVKQRYGKQVRQDIVTETMQQSLSQAIQDEELRPASMPRLESPPESLDSGDLEFSAVLEVYPDIGEMDVSAIEITQAKSEVLDEDIADMLQTLREQRKSWEPLEQKAKAGNQVQIEYSAETEDGRVPEEGTNKLMIIQGESGFEALEKALAKLMPGEEKQQKLTFPEQFRDAALAGKKATVDLKLVAVAEAKLPEVDEAFIQSFGIEDGSEETLNEEIRKNLNRELSQAISSMTKNQLIKNLVDSKADLDVPMSIVKEEAANLAKQATAAQGLEPDDSAAEQFMAVAEERVRGGLLLGELSRQNGIRIDGAKVRQAIENIASTYQQPQEVVQMYYSNQQLLQQVESSVMEDQVVDWVLENAKVIPQEMKFKEVISKAAGAVSDSA